MRSVVYCSSLTCFLTLTRRVHSFRNTNHFLFITRRPWTTLHPSHLLSHPRPISNVSMTAKPPPTDLPIQAFKSVAEFAAFLDSNHSTSPGVYVKFAKKGTGIPSILPAEAVETALCYGWIDGRANSIDETWWTGRYTPRRAKSIWSQKNVTTIARLIEEGKMKPSGMAQVQAAKSDGRWDKAYAGPATITTPADFEAALKENETAWERFQGLNKSQKYPYLHRLATVSAKGRAKKITDFVRELAGEEDEDEEEEVVDVIEKKAVRKPKKESGSASKVTTKKTIARKKTVTEEKVVTSESVAKETVVTPSRRAGLRART